MLDTQRKTILKQHYGLDAVRANLAHFIMGKALTAVSSVVVLLLVARVLPVPEFAAYAVFQAVIVLVNVISDFGVGQAMVRYVPELRAANNNLPMYQMIFRGAAIRMGMIAATLTVVWLTASWWSPWFKLDDWLPLLVLYLPVGWLRLSNLFVFRTMESLLWQKVTQYSMAGGSLTRLALVLWLIWDESLSLQSVVLMELASELVIFALLLAGFLNRWRSDPLRTQGDRGWLPDNWGRLRRFALWGYLQGLATVLYGGSANRIAASATLPTGTVGLFGFVDSLTDYGQRYLPTRMLHGMIQPLFFARYSQSGDFKDMGRLANMTFRASLLALGLPAVVLLAAGEPLLNWLTAGKYGQAAYLVAGMIFVLGLESLRSQMELMVQAVERNEIFLVSNLMLSSSLLISLALLPYVGLWAFVVGAGVGNLLSLLVVTIWFRKLSLVFQFDWWMTLKSFVTIGVAGSMGAFISQHASAWIGVAAGVVVYALITLVWPPIKPAERLMLIQLLKRRQPAIG